MTLRVLDTDILSLLAEGDAVVSQNVGAHADDTLAITVITVEEQVSGWYTLLRQSKKKEQIAHAYARLGGVISFLARWNILSYSEAAIDRFEDLRRMKLGVRAMDLRIAAITLENNAILVTRNLRDFQRIPNLVIEDWSK